MKVKVIELDFCGDIYDDIYDDEYEYYGIDQGGVYEVINTYPDIEAIVVVNKYGRNVMLYNREVEIYEEK